MSSETDNPRQRTVAELLAEHGESGATGRRRRRREADVPEEGAAPAPGDGAVGTSDPAAAAPNAGPPPGTPARSAAAPTPAPPSGPAPPAARAGSGVPPAPPAVGRSPLSSPPQSSPPPSSAPQSPAPPSPSPLQAWSVAQPPTSAPVGVPPAGAAPPTALPVRPRRRSPGDEGGDPSVSHGGPDRSVLREVVPREPVGPSASSFFEPFADVPRQSSPPQASSYFEPVVEPRNGPPSRRVVERPQVPLDLPEDGLFGERPTVLIPRIPSSGPAPVGPGPTGPIGYQDRTSGAALDGGPPTETSAPMDFDGVDNLGDRPPGLAPTRPRPAGPDAVRSAAAGRSTGEPTDSDELVGATSSTGPAWMAVLAQWIVGAVGGAALWVGFRFLWRDWSLVALAAAVLVTVGLVLVVRTLLRNNDLRTTIFAVLVGLLLTVSPAILVLIGR